MRLFNIPKREVNLFLNLLLILAIAIGFFLRFYKLREFMPFAGDQGRDFLILRDMIINHKLPLVGPPTSLGWFYLGPFAYYLFLPALLIGRFHPNSLSFLLILFDLGAIVVLFKLAKEIFDKRTAVLVGFLYAFCPFAIIQSRDPLHVSLAPFFSILFILFLWRFLNKDRRIDFFLCCLVLGILLQIHLATVVLLFAFLLFVFRKINWKEGLFGFLFFIFPLLPFLITNIKDYSSMIGKIILWFPYRFFSTFGFFTDKNILTFSRVEDSFRVLLEVAQKVVFLPQKEVALFALFFVILVLSILRKHHLGTRFLLTIIGISILAFFTHGQPAVHYFTFLVPVLVLILAFFLSRRIISYLLVILLVLGNTIFLVRADYFAKTSLTEQIEMSNFIIENSGDKTYEINSPIDIIGLPDYYSNYKYLTWWLGKEEQEKGDLKYTIYHRKDNILPITEGEVVIEFPSSIIVKSER